MDLIDRVEVIRGPGSSLYGNNAFFAVINVITRRGRDVHGAEVSGAYASYDTYSGRLTYGNKFKSGLELALSGTYYDSGGHDTLFYPEFAVVNNGVAQDADGTRLGSGFASVSYGDFTIEGAYMERTKHLPTAAYGAVFNDSRLEVVDERRVRMTSTIFYEDINDLINFKTDSASNVVFGNVAAATSKGGKVELDANWGGGWQGRVSYTYADARDSATDERLWRRNFSTRLRPKPGPRRVSLWIPLSRGKPRSTWWKPCATPSTTARRLSKWPLQILRASHDRSASVKCAVLGAPVASWRSTPSKSPRRSFRA